MLFCGLIILFRDNEVFLCKKLFKKIRMAGRFETNLLIQIIFERRTS